MKRDIERLATTDFDLVVVGAGIHGACLALEAARSGFAVALIDRQDFGHSTSANSLKIIHGGIRYLQHGDFKRMRESIVSRRAMMQFAPHLVKPLACMMPTYGHGIKGRETMRLAFGLYDLIAWDRNRGLPPANRLPGGDWISPEEVRWVVPGIREEGLTGGAVWYDAIATSTERLVLEYISEAVRYGAVAANYVRGTTICSIRSRVTGIDACDERTGEQFTISGRAVVNAGGPWIRELGENVDRLQDQLWSTAVNVVVRKRLFRKFAVGLEGRSEYQDKDALIRRGKRLFFFVPWRGKYTMIGTTYTPYRGDPDAYRLSRQDLATILEEINGVYPAAELRLEDVSFYHGGLLPMKEADPDQADAVQLEKSSEIVDHGSRGGTDGAFTIKGVKYTTAPDIARKVMRILEKKRILPPTQPGCYRGGSDRAKDLSRLIQQLGERFERLRSQLQQRYGSGWRRVFGYFGAPGCMEGGEPVIICSDPLLYRAEVAYFLEEEMGLDLADVVFRRSGLCSADCPGDEVLEMVLDQMAEYHGWSDNECEKQLARVKAVFEIIR